MTFTREQIEAHTHRFRRFVITLDSSRPWHNRSCIKELFSLVFVR
jgi:hypothetical protein